MKAILFAICIGLISPSFSDETSNFSEKVEMHDDSLMLIYLACGNANLLSGDFESSIQDFQKASTLLTKTQEQYSELEFLVSFGKAIAYDNLGMVDQAKQAIGSLFILINESEDIESNSITGKPSSSDSQEAVEIMRKLASLASTSQIRDMLLLIVDEMSEELLPQFQFSDSYSINQDWDFDYSSVMALLNPANRFGKEQKNCLQNFQKHFIGLPRLFMV